MAEDFFSTETRLNNSVFLCLFSLLVCFFPISLVFFFVLCYHAFMYKCMQCMFQRKCDIVKEIQGRHVHKGS